MHDKTHGYDLERGLHQEYDCEHVRNGIQCLIVHSLGIAVAVIIEGENGRI